MTSAQAGGHIESLQTPWKTGRLHQSRQSDVTAVLNAFRHIGQLLDMDVIEDSPPFDHAGIAAIAVVHVAVELASLCTSCRTD